MRFLCLSLLLIVLVIFSGCASMMLVPYEDVEKDNWVVVTLNSGRKVEGNVIKSEPHQLSLRNKKRQIVTIGKPTIESIQRKPPIMDDFRKPISEEEIESEKTKRNMLIYGIGGSALSLGASFFAGSMASQSMEDGGTILAGTTLVGGSVGTTLFILAGKSKDRKEAIARIQEHRRSVQIKKDEEVQSSDTLQKKMEEEKKKQEKLREEREQLLRELEQSKQDSE